MRVTERESRPGLALGLTLGLLVGSNLVANLVVPSGWYVAWNLAVAAALVVIARGIGGVGLAGMGLGRAGIAPGLRWGGAIGGVIAGVILIAAVLPGTRDLFADDIGEVSGGGLLLRVLVVIPLGTVVMEEIAFRGCLPALLDMRPGSSPRRTMVISALLFGLWHIVPSLHLGERNATMGDVLGNPLGQWAPVAAAVVATSVAGAALLWVRRRADSVVAPMLVHYSLNAAATTAAWIVAR